MRHNGWFVEWKTTDVPPNVSTKRLSELLEQLNNNWTVEMLRQKRNDAVVAVRTCDTSFPITDGTQGGKRWALRNPTCCHLLHVSWWGHGKNLWPHRRLIWHTGHLERLTLHGEGCVADDIASPLSCVIIIIIILWLIKVTSNHSWHPRYRARLKRIGSNRGHWSRGSIEGSLRQISAGTSPACWCSPPEAKELIDGG